MVVAVLTRVAWCRFTALYASSAACAALFTRDRIGGRGQTVTVDMLHVAMHHTCTDLVKAVAPHACLVFLVSSDGPL